MFMKKVKINNYQEFTYGQIMELRSALMLLGKVKGCTFTWDISMNLTLLTEKAKKIEDFIKQLQEVHIKESETGKQQYVNISAYQKDVETLNLKKFKIILHELPISALEKIKNYCEEGVLEASVVSALDGIFLTREIKGLKEDLDFSEFKSVKKFEQK